MCKDLRDNESSKKASASKNNEDAKETSAVEKESSTSHKGCGCGGY